MARLTEKDYSELIDYIIEKLRKLQADDVIRQIQDLEKVSVLEKAGPLVDIPGGQAARTAAERFPNQMEMQDFEVYSMEEIAKKHKKPDKKLVKEAVSEYRLRPMTFRERCHTAIDILESYLIMAPSIVEMTRKSLKLGPDEHIYWVAETGRSDTADYIDIERLIPQAEPESQAEMKSLIKALRESL